MSFNTTNYAKYRRDLKGLCPHMGEREIYRNWWLSQFSNDGEIPWTVHQSPLKGVCGLYHYLYITTTPKGEIYIGIHSHKDLVDGYQGSGDEIQKYKDAGVDLNTTILEFFRTREAALAMEAYVVNERFLVEFGVLNKVPGGDDTRHGDDTSHVDSCRPIVKPTKYNAGLLPSNKSPSTILCKNVSVEMPFGDKVEIPVVDGSAKPEPPKVEPVQRMAKPASKKPATKTYPKNWFPFSRLGVPVGGQLEYIADKSIVATTMNDIEDIKVNGEIGSLKELTNKIAGRNVGNCLRFWSWNGKSLLDIKNEILKREG